MGVIQELAADLNAEERTLRRAVAQGTIRCRRPGPRRIRLGPGEESYLRTHWDLLTGLRRALRTERGVRLAVLYGSGARGDEDAGSDLDLLVHLAPDAPHGPTALATRLIAVAAREVDIAQLDRIEAGAPLLLARVLDEGRVIVDRDGMWAGLQHRRRAIHARAKRSYGRQMNEAADAIKGLTA
jgi:predicted nucleotidyltransferase